MAVVRMDDHIPNQASAAAARLSVAQREVADDAAILLPHKSGGFEGGVVDDASEAIRLVKLSHLP